MSVEFISLNFVVRRFITAILIVSCLTKLVGQTKSSPSINNPKHLNWLKPISKSLSENEKQSAIVFEGAQYDYGSAVPFVIETCDLEGADNYPIFTAAQFETVTDPKEIELLIQSGYVFDKEINIEQNVKIIRKKEFNYCKFFPFRMNKNGDFEKLVSYNFQWKNSLSGNKSLPVSTSTHANSSVLSSGRWYKLSVSQNGIYKIDKDFLFSMGVDASSIDPKNIRIYGNGGKPLPESNLSFKPDDLIENAIFVEGESDGSFDSGDYILFYGQSPLSWLPQSNGSCMRFRHKSNPYSDNSYYFLTVDLGPGKRVSSQQSLSAVPTHNVTSFDDYQLHESNSANLIKSGREWYGESFDILTSYSFNFNFPNIVTGDTVGIEVAIANRMGSTDPNAYSVIHPGGSTPLTTGIVWLNNYTAAFAADGSACASFLANGSSISVSVNKNNSSALGWLNYIRVNARRNLIATSNQALFFRNLRSVGAGNISKYSISGNNSMKIWELTDSYNIKAQQFIQNGNSLEFTQSSDSLREYVVFNPNFLPPPAFEEVVQNQNLHGISKADFIIVAHPNFLSEAQRLADFHATKDSMECVIVTPQQCYNEFSSGSQDITAIREFVRMLYKRAANPDEAPKYLLLFGDGSYKYRNTTGNSNFIPTYQSPQSLQPTTSYTSDDYFGLLDDTEGDFTGDVVDIGIGRIPCSTKSEAENVLNKIIGYCKKGQAIETQVNSCVSNAGGPLGDWRNWICFAADDEDQSLHLIQADTLALRIYKKHPTYNINKIYFDAYKQVSTPGGQSYPDANREFNKQIERGCLVLNYTGHGGELGLAHEGLVGISQIQEYNNSNNLPLWFTATCEFSRYDDPDRVSAGEYVLLNPNGGGIALFSTVRLVYASSNFTLSQNMWNHLLDSVNGKVPCMGEVFMLGKQASFADANTRNFTLLGDPALKLAYPEQVIITDSINGKSITTYIDTIKALKKITVKGHVSDALGNKLNNYNGIIYPVVFDKATSITSLSNDVGSPAVPFSIQKNIIYKGKSTVKNGDFSFSFVVPKDISYNFGKGRISYYSHNGNTDATGYFDKALVGGSESNAVADIIPPEIKLYLNDNRFVSGGTTNENPSIYAEVSDSSGINTVGNGIGHDILAVLDDNTDAPIVLNDYYQADMDKYQSGKILYGLENLSEGTHKLNLKLWDVQNNSANATTEFIVAKSGELALTHVLNYPNPFSNKTQFFIEHNNCCSQVNISINVFTISGKVVKSITKTLESSGFRSEGIDWDGKDDFGDKLGKGVYIYKVKISDDFGKSAEQYQKLVILN